MDDKQKIAYLEAQLDILLSGYDKIEKLYDLLPYYPTHSDSVRCLDEINIVRRTTIDSFNRVSSRYRKDE